jgi:hypothetical protein
VKIGLVVFTANTQGDNKKRHAAAAILPHVGPWESARRPPPTAGTMRLNILTPVGLHFGEGPFDALERDSMAGPLVRAATKLMAKLTSLR